MTRAAEPASAPTGPLMGQESKVQTPIVASVGTTVFLMSFFVSRIQRGNSSAHIELNTAKIAIPILIVLALWTAAENRGRQLGLWFALSSATAVSALYLYRYDNPPVATYSEFAGSFSTSFLLLVSIYGYCTLLFEQKSFIRQFRWFSIAAIAIGFLALLANRATGQPYLVSFAQSGNVRMQSLLSEPSALAPLVAAGLLMGWRRRDPLWFGAACVGLLLTESPTVYATCLLSVVIFWGIRQLRRLAVAASVIAIAVTYLARVDYANYVLDPSAIKRTIGRLSSGVVNVLSGGVQGQNLRFAGAKTVWDTLNSQGWLFTGYGLNSSSVYFPAIYGEVRDYSLPLNILFSFGVLGLALFLILLGRALFNSVEQELFPIFLAFAVATSINSAEGFSSYQFVILGMILFVRRPHRENGELITGGRLLQLRDGRELPASPR